MQGIFRKENTDKALKYGIYRHLPTYEKIIRNLVSFYTKKSQFEQSKQAMAKVLTNISHDIRTPLTVLKGNSEMLSNITNTYSASENVHAMAVKIDQKADDLISTINDYFTMSKITSGDFSIKMKKENISSNGKNIIEIEDRGDGISPQQQKQIFERNYTTARKTSGSGLGLSISKCLAEQIGADLEVYSVQNEQTIFSIILKKLENR